MLNENKTIAGGDQEKEILATTKVLCELILKQVGVDEKLIKKILQIIRFLPRLRSFVEALIKNGFDVMLLIIFIFKNSSKLL